MAVLAATTTRTLLALCLMVTVAECIYAIETDSLGSPSPPPKYLSEALLARFEPGTIAVRDGDEFEELNYRLFKPKLLPGRQYPLILCLAGHGRRQLEDFNVGQLSSIDRMILRDDESLDEYPFFLLAPQCPKREDGTWLPWYAASQEQGIDPLEAIERLLGELALEHPIDPERIVVFGISSGGTACWEYAQRHPHRFAAIVPMASFPEKMAQLQNLKNVSTWAFHSSGDQPEIVRNTVRSLDALGAESYLTEIPVDAHDCWHAAFAEFDLLPWMLAQERQTGTSNRERTLAGMAAWQQFKHNYLSQAFWNEVWPRALPVALVCFLYVAAKRHVAHAKTKGKSPRNGPALEESSPDVASSQSL